MKSKITIYALLIGGAISFNSCGVYKPYEMPQTMLTQQYQQAREAMADTATFGNLLWENVFTDPVLQSYINKALTNNNSLRTAQGNVEIAQAQLKGARLSFFPSLTLTPNGAGASYAGSNLTWTYTLPATVSWEVDIFGKLLNNKRSAQAAVYQSEDYAQAVRSQIVAAVANCYYSIASVEQQLELYNATAKIWSESLQVMKNLKEAGRTTEAAVVQSTANYYSVLAGITDLETTLTKLNNTMSLLLNVMPQSWDVPASATLQAPTFVLEGTPMSALAMRPDVAAAEQQLTMAYYGVNSAKAAFYPSLTLTGQGGFTNQLGGFIKNPGDWFYTLAGQLAAPIFSRGQNRANLEAAKVRQRMALDNFEYTLLSAASDVNNGLTVYNKSVEKASLMEQQVANLEKSVEYTNDLLIYGNGTYLEVLTAQQSLLSAQMSLLSTRLSITQSIINLYQAMGGGR